MADVVAQEQPEAVTPAVETVAVDVAATEGQAAEAPAVEVKRDSKDVAVKNETEKKEEVKSEGANILKTTAKIDFKNPKNNRKYDPTPLPVTDDPVEIRKQVEFYFNDSNLPHDKFMWESTGGEENKPMPLKTLCNFKRMRRFQPYTAIVTALRDSTFLDISGEEGAELVKRREAYVSNPEAGKQRVARSVYVKGFGDEESTTQFDIEAFFEPYGPIKQVKLRRTPENLFKGSVFVEFETLELQKAFLDLKPAPTWKGHDLLIKTKKEYIDEKNELIKAGKLEPTKSKKPIFFEGKDKSARAGRGRGGRGGHGKSHDPNDFKKRDGEHRNGGGRGGRGRGRGGRGRGGRDNQNRGEKKEGVTKSNDDGVMPTIQPTNEKGEVVNSEANGKRAREEDNHDAAPPAKKVDTKTEVAAQ
ncbi:La protein [Cladorrhinum sp. PSN259]|nr:La protein [Cladorrhinum sp. PSN259]